MKDIKIPIQEKLILYFALIFGIVGIVISAIRIDILWMLTSFLYTIIIYWSTKMRDIERIQYGIYIWTFIPLFFGITGISSHFAKIWMFVDLAFAAFAPILGFMIILNLTTHTDFESNLYFSTAFIFLFTLSAGTVLGIVRFFNDRFFGTSYLSTNHHLMNNLLIMISFGLLGTVIYFHSLGKNLLKDRNKSLGKDCMAEFMLGVKYFRSHFFKFLNSYFWCEEDRSLFMTSTVLQFGILSLVFYNLAIENFWGYSVALICFILSIFTPIYSRFLNVKASSSFQFWVSAALFLYASGESLGFHRYFGWWNFFSHLMAGMVVGSLIIIYLFYLDDIYDKLHIPTRMIPVFVVIFILSISVLWETFEFLIDSIFGTNLQPNLENTVFDMIGNTIGTFFTLLITDKYTPFQVFSRSELRDKSKSLRGDIFPYASDIPILVFGMFFGVINITFAILRLDLVWSMIGFTFLVLIFGISKINKREKMKWDLVVWAVIPLFIGSVGLSRVEQIYPIIGDVAIAAILPFLSFMVIFNLVYHTSFGTTFRFTIFLMFIFSLGAGILLGLIKALGDFYLGSQYWIGNYHFTTELLIITISSFVGIMVFIFFQRVYYLKDEDFGILNPLIINLRSVSKQPKENLLEILNLFSGKRMNPDFLWIRKALGLASIFLTIYAIYFSNLRVIAISLPAFGFSVFPYLSHHRIENSLPTSFQFWFSLILFVLLIVEIFRTYLNFQWWILITRGLIGGVLTLFIFISIVFVDRLIEQLKIPSWLICCLTLICLLNIFFIENLSAFFVDHFIGTSLLNDLNNIVLNAISTFFGGVVALILIGIFTPFKLIGSHSKRIKSFYKRFKNIEFLLSKK